MPLLLLWRDGFQQCNGEPGSTMPLQSTSEVKGLSTPQRPLACFMVFNSCAGFNTLGSKEQAGQACTRGSAES